MMATKDKSGVQVRVYGTLFTVFFASMLQIYPEP